MRLSAPLNVTAVPARRARNVAGLEAVGCIFFFSFLAFGGNDSLFILRVCGCSKLSGLGILNLTDREKDTIFFCSIR